MQSAHIEFLLMIILVIEEDNIFTLETKDQSPIHTP